MTLLVKMQFARRNMAKLKYSYIFSWGKRRVVNITSFRFRVNDVPSKFSVNNTALQFLFKYFFGSVWQSSTSESFSRTAAEKLTRRFARCHYHSACAPGSLSSIANTSLSLHFIFIHPYREKRNKILRAVTWQRWFFLNGGLNTFFFRE